MRSRSNIRIRIKIKDQDQTRIRFEEKPQARPLIIVPLLSMLHLLLPWCKDLIFLLKLVKTIVIEPVVNVPILIVFIAIVVVFGV